MGESTATPPLADRPRAAGLPWLIAALVAGAAAFWPVLNHQFASTDDDAFIRFHYFVQNPSLDGAWRVFTYVDRDLYQPLPVASLMLDTALFGSSSRSHHAMNLVYHLLAVVAVWRLARRLFAEPAWAGLAAIAWAVHPLNGEVLGIAANRIPLLGALFLFLAAERYLAAVAATAGRGSTASSAWRDHLVIGLLMLLAQLCKATPLIAPGLLALALATPLDPRPWRARLRPALLLLIGPALLALAFGVLALVTTYQANLILIEINRNVGFNVSLTLVALWHSLANAVCPLWMSAWHPRPLTLAPADVIRAGLGLAVVAGLFAWRLRGRPLVWAGLTWWLAVLAPTLPLLTTRNHLTADRYNYLALPGLIVAVLAAVRRRPEDQPAAAPRTAGPVAAGVVLAAAGIAGAHLTLPIYASGPAVLDRLAALYGPDDPMVRLRLATAQADAGNVPAAWDALTALAGPLARNAAYWQTVGHVALLRKDLPAAEQAAERIVALRPDSCVGFKLRGFVLRQRGDVVGALAAYRTAIALNPNDPVQQMDLADLLEAQQDFPAAADTYRAVVARWPFNAVAWHRLGRLAMHAGRPAEATDAFARAVHLAPGAGLVWGDYAIALASAGQFAEARSAAEHALALDPDLPGTRQLLTELQQAR